jgi:nicotinamide riboside kinase
MKTMRIAVCGSAGTGKSTIASHIAERFRIPFLSSRSITSSILKRDGYDYSEGLEVERFLTIDGRQDEILQRTLAREQENECFVTDRPVIDLAAYSIVQLHESDTRKISEVCDTCRRAVSRYTHVFHTKWGVHPIEDNGIRTLNSWYQFIVHASIRAIIQEWGVQSVELESPETHQNVQKAVSVILEG